jgi:uncharacterized protein (TIGR02265 family)
VQQVKGAVLKSRIAFVEEHFGKGAVQRVLESLPVEYQRPFRLLFTSNWYPFELGKRLDDAIVRVLGKGQPELFERLGAASAEKNLTSLHAGYLTPGNPQAFLAKAPQIYSLYYGTGRREYAATGPTSGVLTTYEADTFSGPDCMTVVGWYRKALEMCGARKVSVVEEECRANGGAVCRYRVRWEPTA